jgi:hypothetical protein
LIVRRQGLAASARRLTIKSPNETMARRRTAPAKDRGTDNQLLLVAGTLSGIACLVLVPALYKLALSAADGLFGPAGAHTVGAGGSVVTHEIAPRRWIGGLLVAFVAGLALMASGIIRSRYRLSVRQYWTATVLLTLLSLAASFWMQVSGQ